MSTIDTNRLETLGCIAAQPDDGFLLDLKRHQQNKRWLKRSASLAMQILDALEEKNMSQKDLADLMSVKPQFINKLVSGKVNFTLKTIDNIEYALGIHLDSSASRAISDFEEVTIEKVVPYCEHYMLVNVENKTATEKKQILGSMVDKKMYTTSINAKETFQLDEEPSYNGN